MILPAHNVITVYICPTSLKSGFAVNHIQRYRSVNLLLGSSYHTGVCRDEVPKSVLVERSRRVVSSPTTLRVQNEPSAAHFLVPPSRRHNIFGEADAFIILYCSSSQVALLGSKKGKLVKCRLIHFLWLQAKQSWILSYSISAERFSARVLLSLQPSCHDDTTEMEKWIRTESGLFFAQ
jgi:hypothetical protein